MTKNTMSTNSHICLRMIWAVRISPPRILRRVKLADPEASSSMACLAKAALSDSSGTAALSDSSGAASLAGFSGPAALAGFSGAAPSAWLLTICFSFFSSIFLFLFCYSKFSTSASRVSLLLVGIRNDYLVVHELERSFYSSEEVLFYLSFRIARLHHVLHDAVFQ